METLSLKHFIIFFLIILFSINSLSQIRYIDSVFTSVKKTTGVQYGNNTNYLGIPENLLLDIYEPENDTLSKRPLMIWVHGGAFLSGTRENEDVVFYCNEFAKKGYVTASIDYRLGSLPIITEFMGAVIRAIQDMKAAIRFFR
jgi:para-nitrobenzyl esterase